MLKALWSISNGTERWSYSWAWLLNSRGTTPNVYNSFFLRTVCPWTQPAELNLTPVLRWLSWPCLQTKRESELGTNVVWGLYWGPSSSQTPVADAIRAKRNDSLWSCHRPQDFGQVQVWGLVHGLFFPFLSRKSNFVFQKGTFIIQRNSVVRAPWARFGMNHLCLCLGRE